MTLRNYQPSDCRETARLFYETVHTINARDYTQEQLDAWAPESRDLEEWNRRFLEHRSVVAVDQGQFSASVIWHPTATWTVCLSTRIFSGRESPAPSVSIWSRTLPAPSPPMPPSPQSPFFSPGAIR